MKRLTLVRHANAAWKQAKANDFDRSLTRRGEAEAEALARHLAARGLVPELLISSSAQRAKQTTEILARELGLLPHVVKHDEQLYLASAADILRVARSPGPKLRHLLIVGHNPGLSELAAQLAPEAGFGDMGTAVACTMTFDVLDWREVGTGRASEARRESRPARLFGLWA